MNKSAITLALSLLISPVLPLTVQAQSGITEQDAQSIALDAYIYFYPLVTMDVKAAEREKFRSEFERRHQRNGSNT